MSIYQARRRIWATALLLAGVAIFLAATGSGATAQALTATQAANAEILGPWAPVAACESRLGESSSNVLQITQATWNDATAPGEMNRPDLHGLPPTAFGVSTQAQVADYIAFTLAGTGLGRWPHCGAYYAGCYTLSGWNLCATGSTPIAPAPTTSTTGEPTPTPVASVDAPAIVPLAVFTG